LFNNKYKAVMKHLNFRLLALLVLLFVPSITVAQTKVAYCDVYARGSWNYMKISVIHKHGIYNTIGNIGTILNILAEDGWIKDETIVIPRHGTPWTRHKLHFIMKKEYSEGEDPFANFSKTVFSDNVQTDNDEVWAIESNLLEEFCNKQILQYDEETQAHKVKAFINEIRMNLSQASSMEDLLLVKRKINALDFYNKSCETPKSNITYAVKQFIESVKEKEKMIK
jgi:hypothetical protein